MINTIKKVANFVYDRLGPGHEEAIYRDAICRIARSWIYS